MVVFSMLAILSAMGKAAFPINERQIVLHRRLPLRIRFLVTILAICSLAAPCASEIRAQETGLSVEGPVLSAVEGLPGVSQADMRQMMPVSQLKRGMRGYGLTVFQGTKIERFDVEILGVLTKANLGRDLILVRIGGGIVTSRGTGIIAGMSGSPCYINGKLIGAISYGNAFSKEPIGMVTPITDMLEAFDENLPPSPDGYSSPKPLPEKLILGEKAFTSVVIDGPTSRNLTPLTDRLPSGDEAGSEPRAQGSLRMRPLMTPVMASGLSGRGLEKLAEILRPFHLMPVAGGGGRTDAGSSIAGTLEPGGAFGASLTTGDIDLTAVGTVTYCRDGMLIGFGHPFLGIGAVDAPVTTAYVEDVLSGYEMSFKMATPGGQVGRMFQDRPWSVAARLGEKSRTIPVTVSVDDQATKRNKTYRIEVIDHPLLSPILTALMTSEAIYQQRPTPGHATAVVTCEIEADGIDKIVRTNTYFDPVGIEGASISDMMGLLSILASNRFRPVDIKSVNVRIALENKRDTASIESIFVSKNEFEPGEDVEVGVVFRPYEGEKYTQTYRVKVPATAADSRVLLLVKGGATSGISAAMFAGDGDDDGRPGLPGSQVAGGDMMNAENAAQMVRKYLERERNDQILVQLVMRGNAVNLAGETLSGLPAPIADAMRSTRTSGVRIDREDVKATFDVGRVVTGVAQLAVTIKSRAASDATPRPGIPVPPGPPGPPVPMPAASGAVDLAQSWSRHLSDNPDADPLHNPRHPLLNPRHPLLNPRHPLLNPRHPELDSGPSILAQEPASTEDETNEDQADIDDDTPLNTTATGETQEPAASDKEPGEAKPVIRAAREWTQRTKADFDKGTGEGIAASSKNQLELVPSMKSLASQLPAQFIWKLLPTGDGCLAGSGPSGRIYRLKDGGVADIFYETGELSVHDLVRDSKGNTYAATSPNGRVFVIDPAGSGKLLVKMDERYPLCMAVEHLPLTPSDTEGGGGGVDGSDRVYIGVGDAGKIYRVDPEGNKSVFASLPEHQVLSLAWDASGNLLAGTGIKGVVYRIDAHGTPTPIFDAPESTVTALACDSKGNIYAATEGKGPVYRIDGAGVSESVISKQSTCLSLSVDSRDNVYAACDDSILRMSPDKTVTPLDFGKDKPQILCMSIDKDTQTIYAGTGNMASVYAAPIANSAGTYTSQAHDSGNTCRWGTIRWSAHVPEGCEVIVQTRTGAREKPDSTWTDWSEPCLDPSGSPIQGPNGRFIQYKVTMSSPGSDLQPALTDISASYLTPNQKPTVKITDPASATAWAGKKTIKWSGTDPDKDSLTYDLSYSSDGGATWNELKDETAADSNPPAAPGTGKPAAASKSKSATSYDWDTTKVADGNYLLRVRVNDRASNPQNSLDDEFISSVVTVSNTPPTIALGKKASGVELAREGPVTIEGTATTQTLRIRGVQFRVNNGDWMAAAPVDGFYDSPTESFKLETLPLSNGEYKLEVQAIDTAGNSRTETVSVTVGPVKTKEGRS